VKYAPGEPYGCGHRLPTALFSSASVENAPYGAALVATGISIAVELV
jgi:hypothetical protein